MPRDRRIPLIPFDAGWLFLLPGLALLSATVLIPTYNDLLDARWSRDRSAAIEQNRLDRLNRYGMYLDALEREDPSVVKSLAASQLNMIPESFEPLAPPKDPSNVPATVFPLLEPDPSVLASVPPAREKSRLEIWSSSDRTRVWLIVAGGFCVLIGLLPPASRSRRAEPAAKVEITSPPRRSTAPRRPRAEKPAVETSMSDLPAKPSAASSSKPAPRPAPAADAPTAPASATHTELTQGELFAPAPTAASFPSPSPPSTLPASMIEPKPSKPAMAPKPEPEADSDA